MRRRSATEPGSRLSARSKGSLQSARAAGRPFESRISVGGRRAPRCPDRERLCSGIALVRQRDDHWERAEDRHSGRVPRRRPAARRTDRVLRDDGRQTWRPNMSCMAPLPSSASSSRSIGTLAVPAVSRCIEAYEPGRATRRASRVRAHWCGRPHVRRRRSGRRDPGSRSQPRLRGRRSAARVPASKGILPSYRLHPRTAHAAMRAHACPEGEMTPRRHDRTVRSARRSRCGPAPYSDFQRGGGGRQPRSSARGSAPASAAPVGTRPPPRRPRGAIACVMRRNSDCLLPVEAFDLA